MKKLFAATLFVLAFALTTAAQNACTRVTEVSGGFSYCTPAGWAPQEERGQDFKVVYGPESTALTPNINFQNNTGNLVTLSDFTDAVAKNMLAAAAGMGATNTEVTSRVEFTTDSKEKGIKVSYRSLYNGRWVFMEQYLLDTGKGKLVITCTTLESDKAASVKVFDAVIRSFRIVRPGDPLERYVETAGGFSFAPPLGWTAKAEPGEAFRVFSGPGFTSIRIRSIPSTGTLSADTDAAVRGFSRASANSLVSRTEFVTDSRAKGNKLVLRTDVKVDALITLMYIFDTGKAKLVFTGAMLESEREDNEKLVDAAVRSLQIGQ